MLFGADLEAVFAAIFADFFCALATFLSALLTLVAGLALVAAIAGTATRLRAAKEPMSARFMEIFSVNKSKLV